MDRRSFLAVAACSATTAAAGCLWGSGDDDERQNVQPEDEPLELSDPPAYVTWIDPERKASSFLSVDFPSLAAVPAYEGFFDQFDAAGGFTSMEEAYPAVSHQYESIPIGTGQFAIAFFEVAPLRFPFLERAHLTGRNGNDPGSAPIAIETLTTVDDVTVLGGSIDVAEVGAHRAVSEIDATDDFTIFESQPTARTIDTPVPFAMTDAELVLPTAGLEADGSESGSEGDLRQALDRALEVASAGPALHVDDHIWLINRCGVGAVTLGAFEKPIEPDDTQTPDEDVDVVDERDETDGVDETDETDETDGTDGAEGNDETAGEEADADDDDGEGENGDAAEEGEGEEGTDEAGEDTEATERREELPPDEPDELIEHAVSVLFVADGHETGRETRTGFTFEDGDIVPALEDFLVFAVEDATNSDGEVDDHRVYLEATWGDEG